MKILKQLQSKNWLVVVFFLFIVELLINPIGEFPLNDDWAYSRTIYDYMQLGVYKPSFWQSIFGFTQFLVGLVFCKVFGFSFTLLRFISLLSLVASVYFLDKILKHFKVASSPRLLVLLLFAFNPLTINLSNTFLSDGFQMPLTLASFYFMLKFLSEDKWRFFILFNLFLVMSILNRQNGLVFSIIFLVVYFQHKNVNQKNYLVALLPLFISVFFIWVFKATIINYTVSAPNLNLQWHQFQNILVNPILTNAKKFLYYFITSTLLLGLLILPLSVSSLKFTIEKLRSSSAVLFIFLIYILLIVGKLLFSENVLPFVGNIFYHVGAGPIILSGFDTNAPISFGVVAKAIWISLNLIGGLSFFISVITIFSTGQKKIFVINVAFILLLILYLLPLCFNYVNDRYLFYLLPFYFTAFVTSTNVNCNKLFFHVTFIPILYFSIASTHDYLEINRARETATNHLYSKNISANKIDGGFEFNAWHFAGPKNYDPRHKGRWWWVQDDVYIITPFEYEGYKLESEYYFTSWLSFDFNKIKVMKRVEPKNNYFKSE